MSGQEHPTLPSSQQRALRANVLEVHCAHMYSRYNARCAHMYLKYNACCVQCALRTQELEVPQVRPSLRAERKWRLCTDCGTQLCTQRATTRTHGKSAVYTDRGTQTCAQVCMDSGTQTPARKCAQIEVHKPARKCARIRLHKPSGIHVYTCLRASVHRQGYTNM